MLTKKQKQLLDYVRSYIGDKEVSPSLMEVKNHFRFSSIATAHYYIKTLRDKGYLYKAKGYPRSINIFQKQKLKKIPLLGTIAAGQPIEAIPDEKESIAVPFEKVKSGKNYFALNVKGDSMIDENIENGDIILVEQQNTAKNGDRIVALIDNSEAILKKFYKKGGQIILQPANKSLNPIIIDKNRAFAIQGKVIDVIKSGATANSTYLDDQTLPKTVCRHEKLPLNKIIHGDSAQELKKLPDESCDIIIVDPPYNIGKDFGNNFDKRELSEYVNWCKEWIRECIRVMKPTSTMFIYGFSEILAHISIELPLEKRWLIWHYTNKNVASLNFWQRSHEAIICCWKKSPIFNRDDVREPYTEGFLNGAAGKIRKGTKGRFSNGDKETIYKAHENGALPRDVIKIPALAGGAGMSERWFLCNTCNKVFEPRKLKEHLNHEIIKHPTQKPLDLTQKLIKSSMPGKNGIILVPFVGSGSECVVGKRLGLSYLGFEINPAYIKIAEKWLESTKFIPNLF
ncbi:MAG: transcriptional repressor LexA [Elusimicrobia bacterium]|nr:transcriptional repressor LexA [Elusimicrobiota bacterium]